MIQRIVFHEAEAEAKVKLTAHNLEHHPFTSVVPEDMPDNTSGLDALWKHFANVYDAYMSFFWSSLRIQVLSRYCSVVDASNNPSGYITIVETTPLSMILSSQSPPAIERFLLC
jgi:hypothetical protein